MAMVRVQARAKARPGLALARAWQRQTQAAFGPHRPPLARSAAAGGFWPPVARSTKRFVFSLFESTFAFESFLAAQFFERRTLSIGEELRMPRKVGMHRILAMI